MREHFLRRLLGQIQEIERGTTLPICVAFSPEVSDLRLPICLKGYMLAPEGSPMKDYILSFKVEVPGEFPFKAPKYAFEHELWHPKINKTMGNVCEYKLFDGWSMKVTIEAILLSINYLLANPGDLVTYSGSIINGHAAHQYMSDRDQYIKQSREWVMKSNAGYGPMKFEEYRAMCSHNICLHLTMSDRIKFKARLFCQRESKYYWRALFSIDPDLQVYHNRTESYFERLGLRSLTSFEFDFKDLDEAVVLKIPASGMSLDECWTIASVGEAVITKESCVVNPIDNDPPTCELRLTYRHTQQKPTRLIHKFELISSKSKWSRYMFDMCIIPEDFTKKDNSIDLPTAFRRLLPLAAEWKNIGCLLSISHGKLDEIQHDERRASDCLRCMLDTWLRSTPTASWSMLAEAVEPFDKQSLVQELKQNSSQENSSDDGKFCTLL